MYCRCTKCSKDFVENDAPLYLQTGLCADCRELENDNIIEKSISVTASNTPFSPTIRFSTILWIFTLLVVVVYVYGLPNIKFTSNNNVNDNVSYFRQVDSHQIYEKDTSIYYYHPDLPQAEVIVKNNIATGVIVKNRDIYKPYQITIPEGVTEIADNAFADFYGLVAVTFCDTLERVGQSAFINCYNLEYVSTNDSLKVIDDYAFFRLNINTISLPKSLEYLGVSALNRVRMEDVELPITTYLGSGCLKFDLYRPEGAEFGDELIVNNLFVKSPFNSNTPLHYVIPVGVTSIEDYAFYNSHIESIVIPEGVLYIAPQAFMLCESLTEITFPSSLLAIDVKAFFNCRSLTKINFNDGLKSVSASSFSGCAIEDIDMLIAQIV